MSFAATWMDLEIIILSEVRQRRGDNMLSLILEILKKLYKRTYLQNRNNSQTQRTNLWLPEDGQEGGEDCESGTNMYILLYLNR